MSAIPRLARPSCATSSRCSPSYWTNIPPKSNRNVPGAAQVAVVGPAVGVDFDVLGTSMTAAVDQYSRTPDARHIRVLDADQQGADWRDVSRIVLHH
jgi:hypothetical protein